jgi:hypothetical protein
MKKKPTAAKVPILKPAVKATDTRSVKPPALIVTVEEDFFALLDRLPSRRPAVMIYEADKIPDLVACCNPRCRGGGLDLSHFVRREGEHTIQCDGYEGARRDGQRCDNHWNLTVSSRGRRLTR